MSFIFMAKFFLSKWWLCICCLLAFFAIWLYVVSLKAGMQFSVPAANNDLSVEGLFNNSCCLL
jgi:YbbR domain-containing protein